MALLLNNPDKQKRVYNDSKVLPDLWYNPFVQMYLFITSPMVLGYCLPHKQWDGKQTNIAFELIDWSVISSSVVNLMHILFVTYVSFHYTVLSLRFRCSRIRLYDLLGWKVSKYWLQLKFRMFILGCLSLLTDAITFIYSPL